MNLKHSLLWLFFQPNQNQQFKSKVLCLKIQNFHQFHLLKKRQLTSIVIQIFLHTLFNLFGSCLKQIIRFLQLKDWTTLLSKLFLISYSIVLFILLYPQTFLLLIIIIVQPQVFQIGQLVEKESMKMKFGMFNFHLLAYQQLQYARDLLLFCGNYAKEVNNKNLLKIKKQLRLTRKDKSKRNQLTLDWNVLLNMI